MYEVGFYRPDADNQEDLAPMDLWVCFYRSYDFEQAAAEHEALSIAYPAEAWELVS